MSGMSNSVGLLVVFLVLSISYTLAKTYGTVSNQCRLVKSGEDSFLISSEAGFNIAIKALMKKFLLIFIISAGHTEHLYEN